ncbi:MAG: DUF4153 domain-containing protein [Bacillota bacterium]|nr:DUF4153 domain-containing protein [Bacillota bacterium]MDW7678257.1 DUF4153 domain-containing protein [Bacillota bacterium]
MTMNSGEINPDSLNGVTERMANPHELESLFRKDPETFRALFSDAWQQHPDSQVLAVWHERLHFSETAESSAIFRFQKEFITMGIFAVLAGITTRVLFHFVERQTITPVNLIFGVLPFMAAYFVSRHLPRRKVLAALASLFLIAVVYMNLLPMEPTDSIVLAYLHLPVFLWALLGLAFTGNDHGIGGARLAYLKFNGEFIILYAVMAISGMLLTALTMQLFGIVGLDIAEFYFRNVVLFGAASLAVVTAYLVSRNLTLAKHMAPFIARIFSPLVLTTLLAYLVTVIWVGKNPFLDRDFLLSFNGILLSVLAVTIFSITERGTDAGKSLSDYINAALIVLALIIDSVALSAIVFRLSTYGITPNRVAVLGVNLLIWANLIWILSAYVRFLQKKTGLPSVQEAVTRYLPVYGLWAAFVTFAFPLIFYK